MSTPAPISRPPTGASGRRVIDGSLLPWITTPLLLALLAATWHFYVQISGISKFILPAPADVWAEWRRAMVNPRLWNHTYWTLYATLAGFFWASSSA